MRWLLPRTFILCLIFCTLLVATQWIGSSQKNPAAEILKLDAEQLSHSCWHHICLRKTTIVEAETELRNDTASINDVEQSAPVGSQTTVCWDNLAFQGAENCAVESLAVSKRFDYIYFQTLSTPYFPVTLEPVLHFRAS